MKNMLLILLCVASSPTQSSLSQTAIAPAQITTSGSAEVKVAPDEVLLSVGVETRDENLQRAKKQNDEQVARALSFLKSNGIKEKDVQTDFISVQPIYQQTYQTKPTIYEARKSIQIKLTKIEGFEGLLTGLLTNGVGYVHGVEFRTTQLRKFRDEARAMAVRAAREKADALASELGVKCGKVYNITASDWGGWWSPYGGYWGARGGGNYQNSVQNFSGGNASAETGDSGSLSVGQISISASVNVSFLIR